MTRPATRPAISAIDRAGETPAGSVVMFRRSASIASGPEYHRSNAPRVRHSIFPGNPPSPRRNRADALGRAFSGKRPQNPHTMKAFSRRQFLSTFAAAAVPAMATAAKPKFRLHSVLLHVRAARFKTKPRGHHRYLEAVHGNHGANRGHGPRRRAAMLRAHKTAKGTLRMGHPRLSSRAVRSAKGNGVRRYIRHQDDGLRWIDGVTFWPTAQGRGKFGPLMKPHLILPKRPRDHRHREPFQQPHQHARFPKMAGRAGALAASRHRAGTFLKAWKTSISAAQCAMFYAWGAHGLLDVHWPNLIAAGLQFATRSRLASLQRLQWTGKTPFEITWKCLLDQMVFICSSPSPRWLLKRHSTPKSSVRRDFTKEWLTSSKYGGEPVRCRICNSLRGSDSMNPVASWGRTNAPCNRRDAETGEVISI